MARARLKNFYFTPRRLFTAPFERALGFFMPFSPINDKKMSFSRSGVVVKAVLVIN